MSELVLTGLDAQNPLAFLASLGLLRVLDDHARVGGATRPRLGFVDQGNIVPRVTTSLTIEQIIAIVLEDAAAQADNPVLRIAYDGEGNEVPPNHPDASHDLKPPPVLARRIMERLVGPASRASRLGAALFNELIKDKTNGNAKPTAFHFTAGNQAFLAIAEKLRAGISAEDLREALTGPWERTSSSPTLRWDSAMTRLYALRATDPARAPKSNVPGADWLALLGLEFFPVHAIAGKLATTCVAGGWRDSAFTWPVWEPTIGAAVIASLLRSSAERLTYDERRAMGVITVLRSRIQRDDYANFAPAEVVVPATARRRLRSS